MKRGRSASGVNLLIDFNGHILLRLHGRSADASGVKPGWGCCVKSVTLSWPVVVILWDYVKVSCQRLSEVRWVGVSIYSCASESSGRTMGLNFHVDLGSYHEMVGPTLHGSIHDVGGKNFLSTLLTDNYIVQEVAGFWSRMLPGCFEPVLHLEGGVCDDQLFSTERHEAEPIAVHFSHSMLTNHPLPYQMLCAHTSIQISQEFEPVHFWSVLCDWIAGGLSTPCYYQSQKLVYYSLIRVAN